MVLFRRTPLVTGEFYHIFNRGVAKAPTFFTKRDYKQALLALKFYQYESPPLSLSKYKDLSIEDKSKIMSSLTHSTKLVDIHSFVLIPNHFHLILNQLADGGISKFVSQFTNSYTRYLNTDQKRVGPLFQGVFKSVHIESDEQLIHLSRYIHLNPVTSYIIRETEIMSYLWSSFSDYINGKSEFVNLDSILSHFKNCEDYKKFVLDYADYAKKLEEIKHLTLEEVDD